MRTISSSSSGKLTCRYDRGADCGSRDGENISKLNFQEQLLSPCLMKSKLLNNFDLCTHFGVF